MSETPLERSVDSTANHSRSTDSRVTDERLRALSDDQTGSDHPVVMRVSRP